MRPFGVCVKFGRNRFATTLVGYVRFQRSVITAAAWSYRYYYIISYSRDYNITRYCVSRKAVGKRCARSHNNIIISSLYSKGGGRERKKPKECKKKKKTAKRAINETSEIVHGRDGRSLAAPSSGENVEKIL